MERERVVEHHPVLPAAAPADLGPVLAQPAALKPHRLVDRQQVITLDPGALLRKIFRKGLTSTRQGYNLQWELDAQPDAAFWEVAHFRYQPVDIDRSGKFEAGLRLGIDRKSTRLNARH